MLSTLAPGKVNLCLLIGAPRPDGLHPLVSLVQPTQLADEVTLETAGDRDTVICPGVEGENLALRALSDFRAATGWDAPPQTLTITKRIPIAGQSARAAASRSLTYSNSPARRRRAASSSSSALRGVPSASKAR